MAWLVRKRSWPRLEARTALPAELRRMIEAYAAQQPAGANGKRVAVSVGNGELASNEPAVRLGEEPARPPHALVRRANATPPIW